MYKHGIVLVRTLCALLIVLYGCGKEVIDVTITEVDVPSPEAIAAVDCPEFMLDMGDSCMIENQEGLVSIDCECLHPDSADVIELEFIHDVGVEIVVTVETEPAFLAGKTYVIVPVGGIIMPYYVPVGTTLISAEAYFVCPDVGVSAESASYSNSPSVDGALVQLHVDCQ